MMENTNLHATIAAAAKALGDSLFDGLKLLALATREQPPEAPASITAKVYDANGFDLLVTVRNGSMKELAGNWGQFSDYLIQQGYTPQGGLLPAAQPQPPQEADPAEVEAELNPGLATSQPPPGQQNGGATFAAEKMKFAGNTKSGEPYWRVFGGNYQQYGVPIYEAVNQALADGVFFEEELDPRQEYDLRGITAHVVMKENGQPRKVTRLERPQ